MFILTKLPPLPPALNNLFNYLILISIITLPAQAKIIQRKMHMVCQEHESAYWDGSKGVCCDGNVYQPDTENTSFACCPTGKEVSIVQGKENLNHCCSEGQKAYWNGSSAQCCATATHQIVTNYISGQTDTAYACCEIKEDTYSERIDTEFDEKYTNSFTGYTVAGAINNSCCGGYSAIRAERLTNSSGKLQAFDDYSSSYKIRENGGVYYCAEETDWLDSLISEARREKGMYISDSKYCISYDTIHNGTIFSSYTECRCSDKDDPRVSSTATFCDL